MATVGWPIRAVATAQRIMNLVELEPDIGDSGVRIDCARTSGLLLRPMPLSLMGLAGWLPIAISHS